MSDDTPLASLAARLAANVRALRERTGLTQAKLAARAGLPRATWAHLESGAANPTHPTNLQCARSSSTHRSPDRSCRSPCAGSLRPAACRQPTLPRDERPEAITAPPTRTTLPGSGFINGLVPASKESVDSPTDVTTARS